MIKSLLQFCKTWTLPIAMIGGALVYFTASRIPVMVRYREFWLSVVSVVQPLLIFILLFLAYTKTDLRSLRLRRWHGWLLLFQSVTFTLLSLLLIFSPAVSGRVVIEGAMLCLICPTATAAVVVTSKLGGDTASLTAYTILVNLLASVIVPLFVPLVNPHPELNFITSFFLIMGKVFPMLICPLVAAMLVRRFLPRLHSVLLSCRDLSFYIWAVSLSMAIAVTVRSIVHSDVSLLTQVGIAAISLISCVVQFALGRRIGRRYGRSVTAGQALGQKNTVFAIWMGYTFLTPVSAVAGGFYSVWHNVFNSWQLYKQSKTGGKSV